MPEYEIDYDSLDVEDLMRQVRERARADDDGDPVLPALDEQELRSRLREYVDMDDEQPYLLQQELGLLGGWNVTPDDARASHPGVMGGLIRGLRSLLRPVTKLFVNPDLALFKQYKINLGLASAVHDLLRENQALRTRMQELSRRVDRLDDGPGDGT